MRLTLAILLSSFTFLSIIFFWINSSKLQNAQNIVVVSFCSLRKDLMESFTKDRNLSQDLYIDKLAKKSIIFKDMVSYDGWRGLSRHLKQISLERLHQKKYQIIGTPKNYKLEDISDSTLRLLRFDNKELYFQKLNSEVKESSKRGKPFFISMYFEWSHFPFNDSVDENLDNYLKTTIKSGNDINNRLPFLSALIPHSILRNRFPQKYPKILKEDELAYAWKIFKDPQNIARWKKSPYFHSDILLLKKYYITRIKVLDHDLENFLHPLENNSHIVFVSCHGQPFLENNDFFHGNPFDENTGQLPAFIHLAGQNHSESFEEQTGMQKLGAAVAQLTTLDRNPSLWFAKLSKDLSEPQILQYDCAGENMAIRDQGKFKYIYNFATGEEELFQIDKENQKLIELDQNNFKQAIIKYKETIMSKASEILNLSQKMKDDGYCFYNYAYSSRGK